VISRKIIALTASAMQSDLEDCLVAGMDAHVSKPINRGKLESALTTAVTRIKNRGKGFPAS